MIEFNMNDYVWVRLTARGYQLLCDPATGLPARTINEDSDGWSRWQLWDLMCEFGPFIHLGCIVPFETTIKIETGTTLEITPPNSKIGQTSPSQSGDSGGGCE